VKSNGGVGRCQGKPPPRRAYTDLGWIFAALTGSATLPAVWIYCAVTYGFLLGFFLGWPHPRIAGCRGDDLFMAVGSGSGSICDLPSFRPSSRVIDLHRRIRRHHRNRNDLVVACSEQQVLKWTIGAGDPIDRLESRGLYDQFAEQIAMRCSEEFAGNLAGLDKVPYLKRWLLPPR
jgi:hypothetical protein